MEIVFFFQLQAIVMVSIFLIGVLMVTIGWVTFIGMTAKMRIFCIFTMVMNIGIMTIVLMAFLFVQFLMK